MRILIVDDSEQMPDALRSLIPSETQAANSTTNQSGIFAAFSLPEIVRSRLTNIRSPHAGSDSDPSGTKMPDFASLHLENAPELMATLLNTIGLGYLSGGRLDEARCFIEQALQIRTDFFGAEHPQTAFSINGLARVLRDEGRLDEALEHIERAARIDARVAGGNSLVSAGDLAVLASIRFQRGELTEAEHSALLALKIFEEKLKGIDPWVPYLLDIVARVHQWRADYRKASEVYQRIMELDLKLYDREHPVYAVRLHNYATVLEARGELKEAKGKYDEAIAILAKASGEFHPNLIDALGNRGALRLALKDFEGAHKDFEEALERNRKVRGQDHPFVGYDLLNLAQLAFDQKELGQALQRIQEALGIFRAKLPAKHAYLAAALTLQGRALVENNNPGKAVEPLEEAIGYWLIEFGERSPEHAISRATLARAWFLTDQNPREIEGILRTSLAIIVGVRGEDDGTANVIREWLEEATSGSCPK